MPRIRIRQGDITTFEGDAIVSAANERLLLQTGVAGAVRQAGGPTIQDACNRLAPVAVGDAVITDAGKLAVRWVIHAVIMGDDPTSVVAVRRATSAALHLAAQHAAVRIAMPILGTGVGRLPLLEAAGTMLEVIRESADAEELEVIVLFGYRPEDADALETLLA